MLESVRQGHVQLAFFGPALYIRPEPLPDRTVRRANHKRQADILFSAHYQRDIADQRRQGSEGQESHSGRH